MKTPHVRFAWFLACLICLLPFAFASAASGSDITITVTCDGFTTQGGTINFEGDTTVVIRGSDAAGVPLYERTLTGATNSSFSFTAGETFRWETAPTLSPLIVSITTVEENVLDQDLVYLVVGNCNRIPRAANAYALGPELDLLPLLAEADGSVSEPVGLNEAPPRPTNDSDVVGTLAGYAIVNTDNLFLRSGAGVEYSVIGIVDGGTYLVVLGRSDAELPDDSDELWWYVEVGGLRGWVNSAFLYLRGDLSAVPVVESLGELTAPSVYVGFTGTPLYTQPSTAAPFACTLQGGLFYPVLGRDASPANFFYVEAQCEDGTVTRGWLSLESVLLRNEGNVDIPIVGG
jgi:hypothetical protein